MGDMKSWTFSLFTFVAFLVSVRFEVYSSIFV